MLDLIIGGDINFRGQSGMNRKLGEGILSELLPSLESVQLRIANLESPLADLAKHAPIAKSGPNHMYAPENVAFLDAMRLDLAILANNHIGDYGDGALLETVEHLDAHKIAHIGAGRSLAEAYAPYIVERDGLRLGILATCENEFGVATETTPGSAGYEPRRLYRKLRELRGRVDFLIVIFHGGNEFCPIPSPETVERYRMLCDFGADSVVAMHTHCPQGWEIYDGKPIIYSLGNLLFRSGSPRDASDSWHYGYLARLTLERGKPVRFEPIPYRFTPEADKIHVFEGEERAKMLAYLDKISQIISDPEELANCFKGWARLHKWYAPPPSSDSEKPYGAYNIVRCESHYAQMLTNYRMLLDGETALGDEYAAKIRELSVMPTLG